MASRFYFTHGLMAINLLAAGRALIKLQPWYGVGLTLELAGPFPTDPLTLVAPTSGTSANDNHILHLRVCYSPVFADAQIHFKRD